MFFLAGEAEGPQQARAEAARGHERLRSSSGREDQGDSKNVATDNCKKMGGVPQRFYSRLWRLPGNQPC